MADKKIKVKVDIDTNVEPSIAELKRLKKQLKETAAGSDEFKKLYNQIDDLEDKIKGSKAASSDWIDTLESAGGPIGALGAGLNKLKVSTISFGAALKATGIGLIVGLIGSLTAAFAESDEEMKKFNPIIIQLQKILNGILEAVQPLIDGFIELAGDVLPYVSKAFQVVYSAVTAVFQSLGKIGSAIVKLFKGDFQGAWDDAKSSVTGFVDNYEAGMERYEKGTQKLTKKEKELQKDSKDARDKWLQDRLKSLETEQKAKEAALAKDKALAMQSAFGEEQKLAVEQEFAQKSYELLVKSLEAKQALYKKDSNEWKDLQAQKIQAEAAFIETTNANAEKQKELAEARGKAIQDFEVELAKRLAELDEEKKQKDAEKASQQREDLYNLLQADFNLRRANNEATFKDELDTYDKGRQLEREDMVAKKASAEALLAFDKETAAARIQIEKAQQEAKLAIISDALGTLAQAVGENTAAGKALAVAQAVIDTYAGANKALATYPPPFGAIAAGTVIVAGLLNVKKILSTQLPKPPGATSAPSSGAAPNIPAPTVPTIATPQINTAGGNNPTAQIAQTLAQAQKPIKAYVVSGDVSSQQALDRRTSRAATFSGGVAS